MLITKYHVYDEESRRILNLANYELEIKESIRKTVQAFDITSYVGVRVYPCFFEVLGSAFTFPHAEVAEIILDSLLEKEDYSIRPFREPHDGRRDMFTVFDIRTTYSINSNERNVQ